MTDYVTNTAAANWGTSTHFTPNGTPGAGDTVDILNGHTLTIDNATSEIIGESLASGNTALTVRDGGTFQLNGDIELRGDFDIERGATINQFGDVTFNPPAGARYFVDLQNAGGAGNTITWILVGGKISTAGAALGDNAYIQKFHSPAVGQTIPCTMSWINAVFENMGDATTESIDIRLESTDSFSWTGGLCKTYGVIRAECYSGTENWTMDSIAFRDGLDTNDATLIQFNGNNDMTTGTRALTNCDFYQAVGATPRLIGMRARDVDFSGTVFANVKFGLAINPRRLVGDGAFLLSEDGDDNFAFASNSGSQLTNSAVITNGGGNPHHYSEDGVDNGISQNILQDNVYDGFGLTGADTGDFLAYGPILYERCIMINECGAITGLDNDARINVNRCTMWGNGTGRINIGEGAGTGALMLETVSHCLFGDQEQGMSQDGSFVSQTNMQLIHNGFWNMSLASNLDFGANNSYVGQESAAAWRTGTYGVTADYGDNDIYINPGFSDSSRTANTWASDNGLGTVTIANVIAEVVKVNGYDTAGNAATFNSNWSLNSFLGYIRAGFTPSNDLLERNGTTLGAIDLPAPTAITSSGSLQASTATLAGSAESVLEAFGSVQANVATGTGSLSQTGISAVVQGDLQTGGNATGALQATTATLSGSLAQSTPAFSASIQASPAILTGHVTHGIIVAKPSPVLRAFINSFS